MGFSPAQVTEARHITFRRALDSVTSAGKTHTTLKIVPYAFSCMFTMYLQNNCDTFTRFCLSRVRYGFFSARVFNIKSARNLNPGVQMCSKRSIRRCDVCNQQLIICPESHETSSISLQDVPSFIKWYKSCHRIILKIKNIYIFTHHPLRYWNLLMFVFKLLYFNIFIYKMC